MFAVSAEANTSAGAPPISCVTRSEEPAKLKVTVEPGFSFSYVSPSSVNVFFSDAAANTVIAPSVPDGDDAAALFGDEAAVVLVEEQAATSVATHRAVTVALKLEGTAPGRRLISGPSGSLDDHRGRLDHRHRHPAGFESQFPDRLAAHQRDHRVGAALQLHLRHDAVHDHLGDQADETVPSGPAYSRRVRCRGGRMLPREFGQDNPIDDLAPGVVPARRQGSGVDPAADGVVADTQQLGDLPNTELRHDGHCSSASADETSQLASRCSIGRSPSGWVPTVGRSHRVPTRAG